METMVLLLFITIFSILNSFLCCSKSTPYKSAPGSFASQNEMGPLGLLMVEVLFCFRLFCIVCAITFISQE